MTRDEAIKILEGAIKKPNTQDGYLGQAITMAIAALSAEPCDDAISRTRAMETFAHWAEHKDYTHVERHILHAVVDELRAMPSISEQPDDGCA